MYRGVNYISITSLLQCIESIIFYLFIIVYLSIGFFGRFSPLQHVTGTATVIFLIWDQSSTLTSQNIYTSSFSMNSSTIMVNILPVNDPPFFFTPTIRLNYTETDPPTIIRLFQDASVRIGDVDNSELFSARITLESPQPHFDTIQVYPPNLDRFIFQIVNSTFIEFKVSIDFCCGFSRVYFSGRTFSSRRFTLQIPMYCGPDLT